MVPILFLRLSTSQILVEFLHEYHTQAFLRFVNVQKSKKSRTANLKINALPR